MIISGGANIFPAEIEAALINMPEVFDCAVFGAPHPEFGETVIAAVQCADGASLTLEELQQFLSDKIMLRRANMFEIYKVLSIY